MADWTLKEEGRVDFWGNSVAGRGNSMGKGLRTEACPRSSRLVSLGGSKGRGQEAAGDEAGTLGGLGLGQRRGAL